jgi:putative DNA primase/helicase
MESILTHNATRRNPDAEEIIKALGGDPANGMCRCPAHDDKKASLHISEKNGKVLWKCHAGCSQEQVRQALIARGIWSTKLKSDTTVKNERPALDTLDDNARLRRASTLLRAAYENDPAVLSRYFTGRGIDNIPISAMALTAKDCRHFEHLGLSAYPAMVCTVIREDKLVGAHVTMLSKDGSSKLSGEKSKLMFGPVKGGYIPISELDPDRPLIIAEGIETALSAAQIASGWPVIATGSAPNMKSLIVPKASEYIICADNDKNKTGQNAATFLARQLANAGQSVRVAVPEYEGEDWNDVLLNERGKLKTMRDRILNAKTVKRDKRVSALSVADFLDLKVQPCEYLLRPWLSTGSLSMIVAPRGEAKTWLALSTARAGAAGQELIGWASEKRARVMYVDGELPIELLQERLRLFGRMPRDLMILSAEMFEAQNKPMPDLGSEEGRKTLDEIIERQQPDLIVLDSLSTLVRSGVENEAESWAPIQEWLMRHRRNRRSIIFVHHEGKSGSPRGSSKREDVLDTIIRLRQRMPKVGEDVIEGESIFDLEFKKHRRFYGLETMPMVLRLSTTSGRVVWEVQTATDDLLEKVATMLKANMKQKDIAKEVGLTEARISQLVKKIRGGIGT